MLHLSFIINSRPLRTLLLDENESIVAASVRSYRLLCVSVAPPVAAVVQLFIKNYTQIMMLLLLLLFRAEPNRAEPRCRPTAQAESFSLSLPLYALSDNYHVKCLLCTSKVSGAYFFKFLFLFKGGGPAGLRATSFFVCYLPHSIKCVQLWF